MKFVAEFNIRNIKPRLVLVAALFYPLKLWEEFFCPRANILKQERSRKCR